MLCLCTGNYQKIYDPILYCKTCPWHIWFSQIQYVKKKIIVCMKYSFFTIKSFDCCWTLLSCHILIVEITQWHFIESETSYVKYLIKWQFFGILLSPPDCQLLYVIKCYYPNCWKEQSLTQIKQFDLWKQYLQSSGQEKVLKKKKNRCFQLLSSFLQLL